MPQVQVVRAAGERVQPRTLHRWRWFHVGLFAVLMVLVLVGFAPTFFLRPVFTDRPLPLYLYVHGSVLTLWFGLALVQSGLVVARRVAVHRRLGVVGGLTAAVLVPLSVFVTIRAIPRYVAASVDPAEIQFIVIGDLISLAVFTVLVGAGLVLRRRSDWHCRLMTVASIMIIGPAIARLERLGRAVPVPAVLLGLLTAVAVHDLVQLRCLHRATIVGVGVVVASLGLLLLALDTEIGAVVIARLSP